MKPGKTCKYVIMSMNLRSSRYCLYTYSHAVNQMMVRGSKSDQQQEEHANFKDVANTLDKQLMKGNSGDNVAKAIHRSKNMHVGQLLSGEAKRQLVDQRKADEKVQEQYYAYKFQ